MNPRIRASVRAMTAYTPGEQPRAPDLIKLNTNENPYPPSPAVARVLAGIDPAELARYPDPTCEALRAQLAALHGGTPSHYLVANGSDEALRLCTEAFVENGGAIGYFDPSYSLYPVLAAMRGVRTRPVSLWPEQTWRDPPPDGCALFFLTNPNAPTGLLFDRDAIRRFCETFQGTVVIDEAYVDFARCDCLDLALSLPNVLVARTLSKSYSLAGLRLGYLVGPRDAIEALHKLRDSYNIDRIAQRIAAAALADQDGMRRNVARIVATRTRLTAALRARGWQVFESDTNFVWTRPAGVTAQAVFGRLRQRSIIVRHWSGDHLADFIRITIGTDTQIDRLLTVLQEET